MHLITERLIIRDFSQDDKPALFDMIWQPNVVRFMRDWSEHTTDAEKLTGFIEYMQSKSACTDVRENKRYGIELRATGQLIGMVGMGLEERRPIGHKQPNMVSDSYYYYRKYRAKNESNGG